MNKGKKPRRQKVETLHVSLLFARLECRLTDRWPQISFFLPVQNKTQNFNRAARNYTSTVQHYTSSLSAVRQVSFAVFSVDLLS